MPRQLDPVDFLPLGGAEGPVDDGLQLPPGRLALGKKMQGHGKEVSEASVRVEGLGAFGCISHAVGLLSSAFLLRASSTPNIVQLVSGLRISHRL